MQEIPLCPILTPTYKQFKKFSQYVEKVEKQYRGQYGMVKIIPPREWQSRCKKYEEIKQNLLITKPEYQTLYGNTKNYYFTCKNKSHPKMTIKEYMEVAKKKQKQIKVYTRPQAVQEYFWSILNTLSQQLYGANIETSLMDSSSGQWEFTKLKSFFSEVVKEKIHGLNTSFLFVGAWKTFFNWHIEDLDLSAINLLHEGASKMWYGIHPGDRKLFEGIMGSLFIQEQIKCKKFMRHKQTFLNPYILKKKYPHLRISKMFQKEGEISLAFAQGYHSGFNMGFNIAEAVNYGTIEWFDRYSRFQGCKCPMEIGVKLEDQEMIDNIKASGLQSQLKQLKAYKALQKKIENEDKHNLLFQQADSAQIEAQIKKQKKKGINKGKKMIYVPKYKRFFPAEKQTFVQCSVCQKWRKTAQQIAGKLSKTSNVKCEHMGFVCNGGKLKDSYKPGKKEDKRKDKRNGKDIKQVKNKK